MTTIIPSVSELLMVGALTGFSIYDIRRHRVPDKALLGFLPVALLSCGGQILCTGPPVIPSMLLGSAAGFGILLTSAMLTKGGIGGGDIKLAAILGLSAGLRRTIGLLGFASVAAVLAGLVLRLMKKPDTHLPFVPFMTAGYFLTGIL